MTRREVIELILKMKGGKAARRDVKGVRTEFKDLRGTLSGLRAGIAGIGVGVMVKQLFDAGVEAQRLNRSMVAITGSSQKAANELDWLRKTSHDLGQEFYTVADAYKGFLAATQETNIAGRTAREIFQATLESATALGMSIADTEGSLRAFTQMVSKGNVQAEELKGQLGERLYGAFILAAKAMGKNTQELNEMLERGELLAEDLLPKLARELHQKYGKAALEASGDAQQGVNRFITTWKDFKAQVADGGALNAFSNILKELTNYLKDPKTLAAARTLGENIGNLASKLFRDLVPAMSATVTTVNGLLAVWNKIPASLQAAIIGGKLGSNFGKIGTAVGATTAFLVEASLESQAAKIERLETYQEKLERNIAEYEKKLAEAQDADNEALVSRWRQRIGQLKSKADDLAYEIIILKRVADQTAAPDDIYGTFDPKKDNPPQNKNKPDPDKNGKKAASEAAELEARIKRLNAWTDTQIVNLESLWDKGLVSLQDYFNQRYNLITKQYQEELENLKKLAAAEEDPDKKLAIQTEIYERQQQYEQDLIDLANKRTAALAEVAEKQQEINDLLKAAQDRAQDAEKPRDRAPYNLFGDIDDENERYDTDIADMESRHEEELEALEELYEGRKDMAEEHAEYIRDLDDLSAAHSREKEAEKLNHEKKIAKLRIKLAAKTAGLLADTMYNLYVATGESNKMLLELYKAAAISQTIINTAAAIMDVWAHPGMSPYEKIGWTIYVTALGAAQVATISAQKLAYGGPVSGHSPNDKADNVPIWATAGEFMQPVAAVKYYGLEVMDALRRRAIPKNLFSNLSLPAPQATVSYALAEGGSVPASRSGNDAIKIDGDLVVNVKAEDAQSFAENPEIVASAVKQAMRLGMLRGSI